MLSSFGRSKTNAPLLVAVAAVIGVGGLVSFQWLGRLSEQTPQSPSAPRPANGKPSVITSRTHSDAQAHSPNVQSAGDYHIEAQMDGTGKLELYVYGAKEKQLSPLPTIGLDLTMEAKAVLTGEDSVPITLKAKPYPTDPQGFSSRFVGSFARRADQTDVGLSLTLPIDDKMYRVQWRAENLRQGQYFGGDGMPVAVSDKAAEKLFLTPGGLYTKADIAANGNQTAKQKYGSQMSSHNAHPRPGDRICPITDTVSNSKFSWVVGGKTYQFCCPPCVEEFVKQAKEKPASVKAPENYVQM